MVVFILHIFSVLLLEVIKLGITQFMSMSSYFIHITSLRLLDVSKLGIKQLMSMSSSILNLAELCLCVCYIFVTFYRKLKCYRKLKIINSEHIFLYKLCWAKKKLLKNVSKHITNMMKTLCQGLKQIIVPKKKL